MVGFASINEPFLPAVVAAGIVMEVQMAAVNADGDTAARHPGLAGYDRSGR